MKKNPYQPDPDRMQDSEDSTDEMFSVASATDCTGLIPSAPVSESEVTSYRDIKNITLNKEAKEAIHRLRDIEQSDPSTF